MYYLYHFHSQKNRALLLQQKMSDPANCMDGCDWVDDAVAMYKKGLTAGDFEHLKDLAQESNGDLAVTSELKKLEKVRFMDNIAIPTTGSDSVRVERLIKRLVQNDFSRGLVPRSASELFQGATLAELRFSLRVSGVFSDSDDRDVLEGLLKDAPGVVTSTEVFDSLTKATVWVNATRTDDNKFYDMGFGEAQEETEVEALRRQLAEAKAANGANGEKAGNQKKRSKKVKPSKVAGKGTEAGAAQVAERIGAVHALLEDAADHLGQDSIDLVIGIFDQNVEKYSDGSISEVDILAVCEDGLVSTRQAIADAKEEAKKARELAAKAVKAKKKTKNFKGSSASSGSSSSESGSDSEESDDGSITPKSGVASVPWSALKPFKGVVSGKAVTGKAFLKEAQVSMFGGLLATAEAKSKSVTRTVARASAQKKVRDLARDQRTALRARQTHGCTDF